MSTSSIQPQDKYVLRMPDGMRDNLKDRAAANGRSMNAEIINRLEASFDLWPQVNLPKWLQNIAMQYPEEDVIIFEEKVRSYALNLAMQTFKDANDQVKDLYNSVMTLSDLVDPKHAEEIRDKGFRLMRDAIDALPPEQRSQGREFFDVVLGEYDRKKT